MYIHIHKYILPLFGVRELGVEGRAGGWDIISGNEQYLSVHRIRCFEFTFWTWCVVAMALCPLFFFFLLL